MLLQALHTEENRGEPLVHAVEVQNQHDPSEDGIEGSEKSTNVSKVVKEGVGSPRVSVQIIVDLEGHSCVFVPCRDLPCFKLPLFNNEGVESRGEELADGENRVAQGQSLLLKHYRVVDVVETFDRERKYL